MEFIQKYWWIVLGLVAVLFVSRGRSTAGPTVSQIGGDGSAWAQINVQADQADQQARYGLISSLLNWDLAGRQLQSNEALAFEGLRSGERVAVINADATAAAAAAGYNVQAQMAQLNYQAQMAALRNQRSSQTQNNLFGLLNSGLQTFLPLIFGGGSSGGSSGGGWDTIGTPTTFPGSGGGYPGRGSWGGWLGGF